MIMNEEQMIDEFFLTTISLIHHYIEYQRRILK